MQSLKNLATSLLGILPTASVTITNPHSGSKPHGKRSITVAQAKRAARKRRNMRARSAK